MMSVAAPGANGTMIRIGREGYVGSAACAANGASHASAASPATSFCMVDLMASSDSMQPGTHTISCCDVLTVRLMDDRVRRQSA